MDNFFIESLRYIQAINGIEFAGLVFGLLAVYWLIKENILTWPAGIIYCLVTLFVFWNAKLYQDFVLTLFFFIMNIYGWFSWSNQKDDKHSLAISTTSKTTWSILILIAVLYSISTGLLFKNFTDASLPFADATTTGISFIAMWMTARKKIENWWLWFLVNILSTIIYAIKGIHFYVLLYFVYIFLAILGYMNWRKLYKTQLQT